MRITLLGLVFFSSLSFAAMDVPQIQVQGNCDIKVVPDRGTISFTAENQSKDQKEAVKKTNAQINKMKEEISSLGLDNLELKNTHYNVYPVRDYEKEKYVDRGVRVSLTLEVTTSEIAKIGEVMVKASKVGIVNVGALMTFLSLEKSQKEYLKCLDIASEDAKNKAIQLGKKLGFKVGDVINLSEVPNMGDHRPYQEAPMMKSMSMAEAAPVQIESGTQSYSTKIQVTFSIK
jgi:uncharacterized protein